MSVRFLGLMGRVGLALTLLLTSALAQDGLPGGPGLSERGRELARRAKAEAAKAAPTQTASPAPQARRIGTAVSADGRPFDVHAVVQPSGTWRLVTTPPGGTPAPSSPSFDAARHGPLQPQPRASVPPNTSRRIGSATDPLGTTVDVHVVAQENGDWEYRVTEPGKTPTVSSRTFDVLRDGPLDVDPDPTPAPATEPVDPFDLNQPLPAEFFLSDAAGNPNAGLAELLRDGSPHSERYSKGLQLYGDEAFRKEARRLLDVLTKTPTGKKILKGLNESGKQTLIAETLLGADGHVAWASRASADATRRDDGTAGPGSNALLGLGSIPADLHDDPVKLMTAVDFVGHELIHALHYTQGEAYGDEVIEEGPRKGTPLEEERTVGLGEFAKEPISENALRRDLNVLFPDHHFPPRAAYLYSTTDPDHSWERVFQPPTQKTQTAPPAQKPMKGAAKRLDELFD